MSDGDQSTAAPADGKKRKIEDDDGPASTTQTTKSERYYDPAADLVIISSDNVEFRIHPYLMQTHSAVLRDMLSESHDKVIHLSDSDIETSVVLTDFLDVMILRTSLLALSRPGGSRVIKLARKYDCAGLIERMVLQLHRQLHARTDEYLDIFLLALELGDQDLCNRSMTGQELVTIEEDDDESSSDPSDEEWFGAVLPGASALDPTALDLEDFNLVASSTLWAWFRAHRKGFPLQKKANDKEGLKVMRDEFKRLMNLIDAPETLYGTPR